MEKEQDIYKKLARHIDQMPVAFPATESGVEIRILKYLFTPEEAEIAVHLSALPETADKIYKRIKKTGISKERLEKTLDGMVAKGSILGGTFFKSRGEKKYYSKAPLAVGMYELQVNRLTKEFVDNMNQYIEEGFAEAFITPKTSQLKTIPIKSSFMPEHNIATYDDIKQLVVKTEGKIAVFNCVCRQEKLILGAPCKKTDRKEICLGFNEAADYVIERLEGHLITKEECLRILEQNEKDGLVLQPENTLKPNFICSCCSCCCTVLNMLKKFPHPAEYWHSNHFARVDAALCRGCKQCQKRCPMDAIYMEAIYNNGKVASVDPQLCIGCGLCTYICQANAIKLSKKEKEMVPAKDHFSLYRKIMLERLKPFDKLKIIGKVLTGGKI